MTNLEALTNDELDALLAHAAEDEKESLLTERFRRIAERQADIRAWERAYRAGIDADEYVALRAEVKRLKPRHAASRAAALSLKHAVARAYNRRAPAGHIRALEQKQWGASDENTRIRDALRSAEAKLARRDARIRSAEAQFERDARMRDSA